jgi:hypothetical protein
MTTAFALSAAVLFAAMAVALIAFAHRALVRIIADLRADDADEIENRRMREELGRGVGHHGKEL